jgi:hypothetical protein
MLEGNASGKCLEAEPGQGHNGGTVWLWDCQRSNKYEWWTIIQGAPSANPVLENVGDSSTNEKYCLDTTGTTGIQQYNCNTTTDASQRWWVNGSGALHPDGASLYTLQNSGSGKCLATLRGQGREKSWETPAPMAYPSDERRRGIHLVSRLDKHGSQRSQYDPSWLI